MLSHYQGGFDGRRSNSRYLVCPLKWIWYILSITEVHNHWSWLDHWDRSQYWRAGRNRDAD